MSMRFLGVEPAPGMPSLQESVDQTQDESNCLHLVAGGTRVEAHFWTLSHQLVSGKWLITYSQAPAGPEEETLPGYEPEEDRHASTDGVEVTPHQV